MAPVDVAVGRGRGAVKPAWQGQTGLLSDHDWRMNICADVDVASSTDGVTRNAGSSEASTGGSAFADDTANGSCSVSSFGIATSRDRAAETVRHMTDNSTCESALNFTFRSDSLNRCYSKQAIVSNTVQQSPHGSGEHHQATTFTNGKDESRFLTQNYEESFHHTATIGKDSSGWNDRHRCPKAISTQIHQGIASAEAKVSSKPWHEEGWARSLREFANQPSVELLVLSDQLCSFGEVPRLSCRRGEVVVGISRTKPSKNSRA